MSYCLQPISYNKRSSVRIMNVINHGSEIINRRDSVLIALCITLETAINNNERVLFTHFSVRLEK